MIAITSDSNSKSVISASFINVAEESGGQRLPTSDKPDIRGQAVHHFMAVPEMKIP